MCGCMLMAGAMTMNLASAETRDLASVDLPHAVVVGSTTLPSGHYTISETGDDAFLIHSDNGVSAVVLGQRFDASSEADKTHVVLSGDDNALHLDKLFIGGESTGYEFQH